MLECREYRKKPVVIEAIRYRGDNLAEVLAFTGKHPRFDEWFSSFDEYAAHVASDRRVFKILTLEGTMDASPGDWIIKGVKGEFYPCKLDIFEATYEPALSTVTPAEVGGLVERLNNIWRDDGHKRGCAGRTYDCTCGFDDRSYETAEAAADAFEALSTALASERAAHTETKRERDEARKALEPFARNVELIHPGAQDHDRLCDYGSQFNGTPTVGQARAARRALTGGKNG